MDRTSIRRDTRLAGLVMRYHTWPTLTQQTISEHTWQLLRIYIEIFGPPPPLVTYYITYHDAPELKTGDAPFPIKMENPDLKEILDRIEKKTFLEMLGKDMPELSMEEKVRVKICDLIEMHEFGVHERFLGNRYAEPIIEDTIKVVRGILRDSSDGQLVERYLSNRRRMYD